jgi:hypothetical protein
MKHLLACAALCAFLAGLPTGCTDSAPAQPVRAPYRDQRSVTTRPAGPNGRNADVVVRVCEYQVQPGNTIIGESPIPPDAKLVHSIECLATVSTPFYCTLALPEQRYELGGVIVKAMDGWCRIDFGYADKGRDHQVSFSSNVLMHVGETRVVSGSPDGRLVALVLEPVGRSPATRP